MARLHLLPLLIAPLLVGVWSTVAMAFSPPEGPVVLTVTGHPDVPGPIAFDRTLLAELPVVTFTTTTIWTDGPQTFSGVPLAAFLDHLGVDPQTIRLIAANDYAVEFPVDTASEDAPILAFEQNGNPMSLRDHGPVWLIYPYDREAEFRTDVVYSRSIWQLVVIELPD